MYRCGKCGCDNAGGHCRLCGYYTHSNAIRAIFDRDKRPDRTPPLSLTPEAKDKTFANFLGVVVFALLMWQGFIENNGDEADFALAVIAGFATSWLLGRLTVITRPLRWLATVALYGAILAGIYWLLQLWPS